MTESLGFDLFVRDHSNKGLKQFSDNLDKTAAKGKGLGRHVGAGFKESGDEADKAGKKVGFLGTALGKLKGHLASADPSMLVAGLAAIGPAAVPIVATAIPAVAGLGAAFAGAGAAGGVFSKVLTTTFTEVQETADAHDELREKIKEYGKEAELAKARGDSDGAKAALENQKLATQELIAAQKELDPALGRVMSSYRGMKMAAEGFIDANKPVTYGIMDMAFGMAQEHLSKFQPLFDVGARAASNFLIAIQGWAQGGGLKSMVEFLANNGEQTFIRLQAILRNTAVGLGGLFRASASTGQGILGWLEQMSARLANFSQGGGWDRFLNYTSTQGPMVVTLLGNLVTTMTTLVQAVAPFAPISLAIASGLTSIIAAMPPQVLTALVGGWLAYTTAVKAYAAGQMIATVATKGMAVAQKVLNVAMRMNPIGLIVTALILLGTTLVMAYRKSETFRNIVNGAFRAVKNTATTVFNAVKAVAQRVWGWITAYVRIQVAAWRAVIGAVKSFITTSWNTIRTTAQRTWTGVTTAVTTAVSRVKTRIQEIVTKARSTLTSIKNIFSPTALFDAGKKLIDGLTNGIKSVINKPYDTMKSGMDKLKGLLPGSPIKEGPLLSWNNGGAGKRLMGLVTAGIQKGAPGVTQAVARALEPRTATAKAVTSARRNAVSAAAGTFADHARRKAMAIKNNRKPNDVRRSSPRTMTGGGGGGITINVTLNSATIGSPEQVANTIVREMRKATAGGFVIPRGTFQGAV